jgi:glyoxylase I family protein
MERERNAHRAVGDHRSAAPRSGCISSPTATTPRPSTNAGAGSVTSPSAVAFGCADRGELESWQARLDELGVAHDGTVDASYGSGLSFRDPDNLPLEFFAPPS